MVFGFLVPADLQLGNEVDALSRNYSPHQNLKKARTETGIIEVQTKETNSNFINLQETSNYSGDQECTQAAKRQRSAAGLQRRRLT